MALTKKDLEGVETAFRNAFRDGVARVIIPEIEKMTDVRTVNRVDNHENRITVLETKA